MWQLHCKYDWGRKALLENNHPFISKADKWYGVTYKEDKETGVAAIAMKAIGDYSEKLWE